MIAGRVAAEVADMTWGVMSAFRPGMTDEENLAAHARLLDRLSGLGYRFEEFEGAWRGVPETSVFIPGPDPDALSALGQEFGQEAVLYRDAAGLKRMIRPK